MSDEELIAQLRSLDTWAETADVPDLAADRIKQLVAKYDEAVECNEEFFVDNQILKERCRAKEAERDALRAKVARLEGALTDMPKAVLRTTICQGPQWPDDRPGVWLAALEACAKSVQTAVNAAISDGGKDG